MKRSASQELCPDAKRVDTQEELSSSDFSLPSDEEIPAAPISPIIPVADEIFTVPLDSEEDSSSGEEPSINLNRNPPDVTFHETRFPLELPALQLSRRELIALRAVAEMYFSVLSSDLFGCVLAAVYGRADSRVPLGVVDTQNPDVTISLPNCIKKPMVVRHERDGGCTVIDEKESAVAIDFSSSTCVPHAARAYPITTNCNSKTYSLGSTYLELRFNDSRELIARYKMHPMDMFDDVVVFTNNCLALLGTEHFCGVCVLVVLYFSPDLEVNTLHLVDAGWPVRGACTDRDDNLYILAGNNINVYTCDENYCDFVRRIPVGGLFCFGLTPRGGLIAVSKKRVDLYKKKEQQ